MPAQSIRGDAQRVATQLRSLKLHLSSQRSLLTSVIELCQFYINMVDMVAQHSRIEDREAIMARAQDVIDNLKQGKLPGETQIQHLLGTYQQITASNDGATKTPAAAAPQRAQRARSNRRRSNPNKAKAKDKKATAPKT